MAEEVSNNNGRGVSLPPSWICGWLASRGADPTAVVLGEADPVVVGERLGGATAATDDTVASHCRRWEGDLGPPPSFLPPDLAEGERLQPATAPPAERRRRPTPLQRRGRRCRAAAALPPVGSGGGRASPGGRRSSRRTPTTPTHRRKRGGREEKRRLAGEVVKLDELMQTDEELVKLATNPLAAQHALLLHDTPLSPHLISYLIGPPLAR
uniref:Uncharacterized protein n=1 Tax=Oryza barthii TaxID=65489 RepID=A0A0D3H626_9ORYZ